MRFEKSSKLHSFFKRYTFADMEDRVQTLVNNDKTALLTAFPDLGIPEKVICNGYLKDWKCYASINSLDEVPFPNLPEFATDSERLSATLNVEWASPRFHANIWSTAKNNPSNDPLSGDWILEGKFSLYKAFGYPYRLLYPFDLLTNNIAREFAEGVKFGFSIENVGFGFPITSGANQDVITFSGNWVQEIIVISAEPTPVVIYASGSTSPSPSPSPSPTPTPTPTPPPQPVITLTFPSGILRAYQNQVISYSITGLTPSTSFSLIWQKGTTTLADEKTETLVADSGGNYSSSILTSVFNNAPFSGVSGTYRLKVTQSGVSATSSTTFDVATMRVVIPELPVISTANETVHIYGVPYQNQYRYSIYKNNVEISSSPTTNLSYDISSSLTSFTTYQQGTSIFAQSIEYGLGASNTYKIRIQHPTNAAIYAFSEPFTVMS